MADNAGVIASQLAGLGYNPVQIAGIVGNLQHESGLDPTALGDSGSAYGLAQWRGSRLDALHDFAAKDGTDPSDIGTQVRFLHSELQGPQSTAGIALQGAKTPGEAAQAFIHFERPQGYDLENPMGALGAQSRVDNAIKFAGGNPMVGTSMPATYTASKLPATATTPGLLGQPDYAASAQGLLAQKQPGQPQATQDEDQGLLKPMAPIQFAQHRPAKPLTFGPQVRRNFG